nr:MAG TPA: hypothetical protein [Caudoviricetes sp.]
MNLFEMLDVANMENGDVVKLYKSKSKLPNGSLLKMEKDKALALKIDEESKLVNLSTVDTVVNGEQMFADMTQEQLEEFISVLLEIDKQLTLINKG